MANKGSSALLPLQPHGFIAKLPSDVILKIFSYLDQRDCLTCMAVCRYWYLFIPQYAQDFWTSLRPDTRDITAENKRLIRCLGEHVKTVDLKKLKKAEDVYHMINKLVDWGCTKIKSLELRECGIKNQEPFLAALTKIAPHLTHLKILDHGSNIALLHVINACPQLTHFTYQEKVLTDMGKSYGAYNKDSVARQVKSSIGAFPRMTHLCLDAVLDKRLQLDPILQRCPNLRSFTGASTLHVNSHKSEFTVYGEILVNFNMLFDWCPKINHITDTFSYDLLSNTDGPDTSLNDEIIGLRHFEVCDVYECEIVLQHLKESQHTLEYMSIGRSKHETNLDWFTMTQPFQLTRLQKFFIDHINIDLALIITFLNHCPALEELWLHVFYLSFNPLIIQNLAPMQHLRTLECYGGIFTEGLSISTFLERLPSLEKLELNYWKLPLHIQEDSKQLTRLKTLVLYSINWLADEDSTNLSVGPTRLFEWFAAHSQLESLTLEAVSNFGIYSLPALARIRTLKRASLSLYKQINSEETDNADLYQFATLLSGTAIEKLTIGSWEHFPDEVVSTLKKLPQLKSLVVCHLMESFYCDQCTFIV